MMSLIQEKVQSMSVLQHRLNHQNFVPFVPFVAFLMRKARGQPNPFQIPFSFFLPIS